MRIRLNGKCLSGISPAAAIGLGKTGVDRSSFFRIDAEMDGTVTCTGYSLGLTHRVVLKAPVDEAGSVTITSSESGAGAKLLSLAKRVLEDEVVIETDEQSGKVRIESDNVSFWWSVPASDHIVTDVDEILQDEPTHILECDPYEFAYVVSAAQKVATTDRTQDTLYGIAKNVFFDMNPEYTNKLHTLGIDRISVLSSRTQGKLSKHDGKPIGAAIFAKRAKDVVPYAAEWKGSFEITAKRSGDSGVSEWVRFVLNGGDHPVVGRMIHMASPSISDTDPMKKVHNLLNRYIKQSTPVCTFDAYSLVNLALSVVPAIPQDSGVILRLSKADGGRVKIEMEAPDDLASGARGSVTVGSWIEGERVEYYLDSVSFMQVVKAVEAACRRCTIHVTKAYPINEQPFIARGTNADVVLMGMVRE